ncbi:MAG TPA: DUF4167 domain-containing protein [Stellaceae bacterium]|nr:DUF4167 domain-containing protein [Stellaceae bacterium]
MRPGSNKRSRGRNGGGGNMQHNNGRPRPPHRSQTFDSNGGPGIKIRGNAYQVFERYVALAREAASSGDRIAAENFYQHAEHYFRIMNAQGDHPGQFQQRPTTPADLDMEQPEIDETAEGEPAPEGEQREAVPAVAEDSQVY